MAARGRRVVGSSSSKSKSYYVDNANKMFDNDTKVCEQCGKKFIVTCPDYMYKKDYSYKDSKGRSRSKVVYFCRYNHYVEWLKDHD